MPSRAVVNNVSNLTSTYLVGLMLPHDHETKGYWYYVRNTTIDDSDRDFSAHWYWPQSGKFPSQPPSPSSLTSVHWQLLLFGLRMATRRFQRTDSNILKTIEWHSRVVLDMPDLSDSATECPQLDVSALSYNILCLLTQTLSSGSQTLHTQGQRRVIYPLSGHTYSPKAFANRGRAWLGRRTIQLSCCC